MAALGKSRSRPLYKLGALLKIWQVHAVVHQDRRGDFFAIWKEGRPVGAQAD